MLRFDSSESLAHPGLPPRYRKVVTETLTNLIDTCQRYNGGYDPAEDGYVLLLEPDDTEETTREALGHTLTDAPFEFVSLEDGCFVTAILYDNEFGIAILIPEPWAAPALRRTLTAHLHEEAANE